MAIDNDVVIKAACYGLVGVFWPPQGDGPQLGVLGAAPYVVDSRIARARLAGDPAKALEAANALFAVTRTLEPTAEELGLASEIETSAQRRGLPLDAGESQLVAMVVKRAIPALETGDKRAIRSLEMLLDELSGIWDICGKVRCLEQIVARRIGDIDARTGIADAVCAEPDVDRAMTICCRCHSPAPEGQSLDLAGVLSYIAALRADAPRVLES